MQRMQYNTHAKYTMITYNFFSAHTKISYFNSISVQFNICRELLSKGPENCCRARIPNSRAARSDFPRFCCLIYVAILSATVSHELVYSMLQRSPTWRSWKKARITSYDATTAHTSENKLKLPVARRAFDMDLTNCY